VPTELPNERNLAAGSGIQLDPSGDGIETDETRRLISSSKVEGTPVFDPRGEQLGTVSHFMVDKVTGQVAYVVLSFGGFLGLGESYHPLPWRALRYDVQLGGYVVDIDPGILASGPQHGAGEDPFGDRAFGQAVDGHYPVR
jgi:hypothetical protein